MTQKKLKLSIFSLFIMTEKIKTVFGDCHIGRQGMVSNAVMADLLSQHGLVQNKA